MNKKIDTFFLVKANISKKPIRSILLITITSIFIVFLFCGSVFLSGFSKGLSSLSDRLGADIILVPDGYKTKFESIILKGEPSEFYLPEEAFDKIKQIEGIESITYQLYIATLQASCCSFPVQIIGIDYKTDFLIKPWLRKNLSKNLNDNEAVVGSGVEGEPGAIIKFFDKELSVKGKLSQTGTGFDFAVFVNLDTALKLAKKAEAVKIIKPVSENKISVILLKVKNGYNPVDVSNSIIRQYPNYNLFPIFGKKLIGQISDNLKTLSKYIYGSIGVIWVLSALLLAVVFSAIINERKKELSILRILGASKQHLLNIICFEAFLIGLYGVITGLIFSLIITLSTVPLIQKNLNFPFLTPNIFLLIFIALFSGIIGTASICFSGFLSSKKIAENEAYLTMRETE
ncbi:ABC transporter permease [Treponema pedis]|uniref:ABC transporter permease n=1 Tax=Treponema pedis TaxID=409322 RepID=UPI0003FFA14A|nr:ABC transporter permease [Treponema pedis]